MTFRPQDLPELRSEVVHDHATHGPAFFDLCIRVGRMPVRPAGPTHEAATALARAEADRALRGELYWVSSEMTDLALAAAKTLPTFTLMPEDLPSASGFMVTEKPFDAYDDSWGRDTRLTACTWGPWVIRSQPTHSLWVSWYSDRDAIDRGGLQAKELALFRANSARLTYDSESQLPFSAVELPAIDPATGDRVEGEGLARLRFLRAVWLLIQQPLAEETEVVPDRATRKRLNRMGHDPKTIRVINLRRPKGSSAGDGTSNYQHQWIVRGHWRQQWHPRRQVHRPVWIAPHIKGPEGAPLIGGEKVHALKN